jgi:hypothetical protein
MRVGVPCHLLVLHSNGAELQQHGEAGQPECPQA